MTYSIIQKSQLDRVLRLDAEYFQPEYLDIENKLSIIKSVKIGEIAKSVVNFGAYSLCNYIVWQDKGVPYINVGDVKDGYIDFSNIKYIDEKVNEILKKSQVQEGQIILTMAGSIGNVAVAHNVSEAINSNQATAKIALKNSHSPYYVTAFLLSKYGQAQIKREIISSVQPNIFLWQIKNFKIPLAPLNKQLEIERNYKQFLIELENSKKCYQQAEELLLKELGLEDFKTKQKLFSIVNLSDCQKANRIDAEYFQSKFRKIHEILSRIDSNKLINEFQIIKSKNYDYIAEGNIGVIKTKQLGKQFVNYDVESNTDENIVKQENLPLIMDRDVLFASMGIGSLGKTNIYYKFENNNKFTIDSTIRIFRAKREYKILSEVLQVFLNSFIGQEIIYQNVVGSSGIISIYDNYLNNLEIPILPKSTQQKIADLVRRSHSARKKSKELLREAKHKVEELIEKGR